MFNCGRCGLEFERKRYLVQHFNRKTLCMPIESNKSSDELLIESKKKENGITCGNCNKTYKNKNSLRVHKCKSIEELALVPVNTQTIINNNITTQLVEAIKQLSEKISNLEKHPQQITNNIETQNNQQNINVTINNIDCYNGKQVDHITSSPDFKEKVLDWINSKDGLFKYIDYKFFDKEHPENHMIKTEDSTKHIVLHMHGGWKKLLNCKASDLILDNVGVDFDNYFGVLKYENKDDYKRNKKIILKFKDNVIKPLNWGDDISEEEEDGGLFRIEKINGHFEFINEEDEIHRNKSDELINNLSKHIHSK